VDFSVEEEGRMKVCVAHGLLLLGFLISGVGRMPLPASVQLAAGPARHQAVLASLGVEVMHATPSPQTQRAPTTTCKEPVLRARACRSIA
jgi:hypothetical protein